ncbi:MAG: helix-turn-helix domain-containing protein [Saprospiraceae bacterium]
MASNGLLTKRAIPKNTSSSFWREHIGLAPKAFQRVLRFNRVLQEVETRREIVWSELAYDCGFADQAHFIREFRQFAGFNPGDFLKAQRHFTNYVVIR